MARFRPLAWPVVGFLISVWLIYDHWINPDPMVRYPKAEAAGPLFFVIFTPWLVYCIYRVLRPLQLAVGTRVMFKNGKTPTTGFISAMQGDQCTVRTEAGSYQINRYEVDTILWQPSVGDPVKVTWTDGERHAGVVRKLQLDQAQVQLADGREGWLPMSNIGKG